MQTIKAQSCFTGCGVFSVQAHLRASADPPLPRAIHLAVQLFWLFRPLCVCVCVSAKWLTFIQMGLKNVHTHKVNSIKVMTFFQGCSQTRLIGRFHSEWVQKLSISGPFSRRHSVFFLYKTSCNVLQTCIFTCVLIELLSRMIKATASVFGESGAS